MRNSTDDSFTSARDILLLTPGDERVIASQIAVSTRKTVMGGS